jgi:IS4 transposase
MKIVDEMLAGKGDDDRIETITMSREMAKELDLEDIQPKTLKIGTDLENQKIASGSSLPREMKVRFARIKLENGSYEVLATSVLDKDVLSIDDLGELYHMRWGVETFYGIIKTRLVLENFTGYSEEAVRQDFFSTVFLCGVESICILEAEERLEKQTGGNAKKVNKAMSFNAIKNNAFELFLSNKPINEMIELLTEMFLTSPTIVRPDRNPPRKEPSNRKVLYWWQKTRKFVF